MTKDRRRARLVDWKLSLAALVLALMAVAFIAVPVAGAILVINLVDIPKLDISKIETVPQRSKIYAADGSVLANFYFENRKNVPLDQVPEHFQKAVIAIEDRRFYQHNGVDFRSISRAFLSNVQNGRIVEGGSTITQQYVKNVFLGNEKSIARKIREAGLAFQMEQKYPKNKILELYLNTVYFGNGAYGTKSAAETYFGKSLDQLTIDESALLAGITKEPDRYNPYVHPDEAKRRRNYVLRTMLKYKYISKDEYNQAVVMELNLRPLQDIGYKTAPYFVEYVRKLMINKYGTKRFLRGGLSIYTTIDPKMQEYAEQAIKTTLNRPGDPSASLVSVDPKTGYIKAMVGGRDFRGNEFNLAVQGQRQAGSAFKTFVLVTALEKGIPTDKSYNGSSPIVIRMPGPGPDWKVQNFGNSSYGTIPLREATVKSVNVVFAQLVMQVGAANVAEVAKRMGIQSPVDEFPAVALGGLTKGVSALDMASAYGTLATGGRYNKPIAVTKIVDFKEKTVFEAKIEPKQALSPSIAAAATDVLKDVVARGTGRAAQIGRPQAGKTGTSQKLWDAWFVGYTPDLSTAVWVGYPQKSIPMNNVHGISVVGGTFPAQIWKKFMSRALENIPPSNFPGTNGKPAPLTQPPATNNQGGNKQPNKPISPQPEQAPQPAPNPAPETQPQQPSPPPEPQQPAPPPSPEQPPPSQPPPEQPPEQPPAATPG